MTKDEMKDKYGTFVMTDEEMAKEYTNNLLEGVNCNIGNPRARQINSIDVEEAFLAGLNAGRPKWHDLRKDPTDLPKENELYLVFGYTNKREKFYELDVFDTTEEVFLGCGEYVYAWCERPKYTEE